MNKWASKWRKLANPVFFKRNVLPHGQKRWRTPLATAVADEKWILMIDFKLASSFSFACSWCCKGYWVSRDYWSLGGCNSSNRHSKKKVLVLFSFTRLNVSSILIVFVHSSDETDFSSRLLSIWLFCNHKQTTLEVIF